jgi:hypothetical protein
MSIFKKALSLITGNAQASPALKMPKAPKGHHSQKKLTERELLQLESEIGSKLFGEVPAGHRREFFCLDATTWIWHEEWINQTTKKHEQMTIRYEINANGVLKVLEGARYTYIQGLELKNLVAATRLYYEQVARSVYKRDPQTGKSLV